MNFIILNSTLLIFMFFLAYVSLALTRGNKKIVITTCEPLDVGINDFVASQFGLGLEIKNRSSKSVKITEIGFIHGKNKKITKIESPHIQSKNGLAGIIAAKSSIKVYFEPECKDIIKVYAKTDNNDVIYGVGPTLSRFNEL